MSDLSIKENILISNNEMFQMFAQASSELIFVLDSAGKIEYMNESVKETLKSHETEILGKHVIELVTEEYKTNLITAFQQLIDEQREINFECEILPKVGIEQFLSVKAIPINIDNSFKMLMVAKNLTQVKSQEKIIEQLNSQLIELQRINSIERERDEHEISILKEINDLKNDFISSVSHELRTPLASIIGFAETIKEDINISSEKKSEFNEIILSESKRLARLINDVLDYSELESEKQKLKKNSLNIINILSEIIENVKSECLKKEISLTKELPDSEIIVYADEERLRKAINYLVQNAIKFTDKNGRIKVIINEFLKEVEIIISDTGKGINEKEIPFLFEKFNTKIGNTAVGTGFSLIAVKQIIDLHKGFLRVKSEINKGTSFLIKLPKYTFE